MNKEELVKLLKEYKENKAKLTIKLKELKTKRLQLKGCEEIETSLTTAYGINQDIHSKNQISDKISMRVEKNDTRRREIESEIEKIENEIKILRDKTEIVEDRLEALQYKEHKILIAYYITGRTAQDIADNLYKELFGKECTIRYIQKVVDKALQKMINL